VADTLRPVGRPPRVPCRHGSMGDHVRDVRDALRVAMEAAVDGHASARVTLTATHDWCHTHAGLLLHMFVELNLNSGLSTDVVTGWVDRFAFHLDAQDPWSE
jgi:hypothetical protein